MRSDRINFFKKVVFPFPLPSHLKPRNSTGITGGGVGLMEHSSLSLGAESSKQPECPSTTFTQMFFF